MVSIATGSPLIRIMVKSIAGMACGPVHASVYTSEVNSPVLKQSSHLLRENRDLLQIKEESNETGEGEEGLLNEQIQCDWKGVFFQSFCLPGCSQSSTSHWPQPDPQARSSHRPVLLLSHLVPSVLWLLCSSSLDPSISLRNQLGCRVAVMCLHTLFPVVRRKRQGESKCKLMSLKHGFRLHVQHKTVTAHELWHCPEDHCPVKLSKPTRAQRSHRNTLGFPPASGLVPGYLRQSALLACCRVPRQPKPRCSPTQREEKHF